MFELNVNLQCAMTCTKDKAIRNYCPTHLLREGKGGAVYHGVKPREQDGIPGGEQDSAGKKEARQETDVPTGQ